MKNTRKLPHKLKTVALLALCSLLVSALLALPVYGAEGSGACGEGLEWSLSGAVLTISGSGAMTEYGDELLPPWYAQREEITTLVLPEGLTSIGRYAFLGCSKLGSASLPSTVTRIGEYAFSECTALRTVLLGSGLTQIAEGAFSACETLTAISLPQSLQTIGDKAFYRCASLSAVAVPSSVTELGASVFAYCYSLVRATVNAPLVRLPSWTFYGCAKLADVQLPAQMKDYGEYAFQDCTSLSTVFTPSNDLSTADALQEQLDNDFDEAMNGPYVSSGKMPDTSASVSATDTDYTETTVLETDNAVIEVVRGMGDGGNTTTVTATVRTDAGWNELAETADRLRTSGVGGELTADIYAETDTVSGEALARFADENIVLRIRPRDGSVWQLRMRDLSGDFAEQYQFGALLTELEPEYPVDCERMWSLSFRKDVTLNAAIGLQIGYPYANATLCQRSGDETEVLHTVVVDAEGIAWFTLANVSADTEYLLALNATEIGTDEAEIPDTLTEQYGIDYTLTDKNGTKYQISGRSSEWGITGKQFAIYAAIGIGAVVLLVSLVMITIHKISRSKAKYAAAAAAEKDEPIDEEALRLEVMQELLDETKKKKNG